MPLLGSISCPDSRAWRWPHRLSGAMALILLVVSLGQATEPETIRTRTEVTRHTLKELRDKDVVKQRLDYSCGAAALATLLRYYFNEPIAESRILRIMISRLTDDERRLKETRGFSLLDLKRAAEELGYRAAGFELRADDLTRLAAPVIVFIEPLDYKHFAVLRGIFAGRAYLADPARGNVRMTVSRFLGEWKGIVFVVGKPGEEAIGRHPLSVPRADDVDPPLRPVSPLWESGAAAIDLSRRSRPP
jgi:uncharacterized protein